MRAFKFIAGLAIGAVFALALVACNQQGAVSGSVTPRANQDVTLIIRVVPAAALVESGHRSGPAKDDTRPFTYRVNANGRVVCGVMFGDDILDGSPHALARFAWEEANCRGHGGDFP